MSLVSSRAIQQLREHSESMMTDTCVVEQADLSVGAYGETVKTWVTVHAALKCRVIRAAGTQANTNQVQRTGERQGVIEEYRLIVPYGTGLTTDQRVTVDGDVWQPVAVQRRLTAAVDEQYMLVRDDG